MINLENVEHSMTNIIKENYKEVCAQQSKVELYNTIKRLFEQNNLNTKASNRLLTNIMKSSNLTQAQYTVTNSLLSGAGCSINAGTSKDWSKN